MRSPTSTTFSSSKGADTVGEYDDVIDGEAMELNMVVGMEESQRCCSRGCCEGCCDVRRATIIINLIMAVVAVISIILITVTEMSIPADLEELDDDVAKQMYDGISQIGKHRHTGQTPLPRIRHLRRTQVQDVTRPNLHRLKYYRIAPFSFHRFLHEWIQLFQFNHRRCCDWFMDLPNGIIRWSG